MAQTDAVGELVQFIERVGLQVPPAGPSSPVADCKEVINVRAQSRQPPTARSSLLLAALTQEPTSTSDLYARVGYLPLARVGLVPYAAFRAELAKLSAAGLAASETSGDGSTLWRRTDGSPQERHLD